MTDDGKRLILVGIWGKYGCGSVTEVDAHLTKLTATFAQPRSQWQAEAIAYDQQRLLELRAYLVDLERLRDDGPLYPHDVLGGAA